MYVVGDIYIYVMFGEAYAEAAAAAAAAATEAVIQTVDVALKQKQQYIVTV